jgi:hypothetical protein
MIKFFDFDFTPLVIGFVGAVVSAGAVGWSKLGEIVATSKTTIDDVIYNAVNKAIKDQVNKEE